MKILFIRHPKFDYLQDLTYSGLAKVLGPQNIIECRWNTGYHIKTKKYPKSLGYVQGSLLASIKSQLKSRRFDVAIVASCKPATFENYLSIAAEIPASTPVVFIDGGDRSEIGGDLIRLNRPELMKQVFAVRPFDLIFKREYLLGATFEKYILPLPFSFNTDVLPKAGGPLKYDVTFWAVESHPVRSKVLTLMEDQFDCKENGTVRNQVFSKYNRKGHKYLEELSRCKITLNFRGAGWDTLRYWEVPAIGRMMLSQKPQIVIPNNLKHEESVVFCRDDLSDLLERCTYYLKNEKKREAIAEKAKKHILQYHTDVKRAEYILSNIKHLR